MTEQTNNPFFEPSSLYLQFPPFDKIEDAHYMPAFTQGMKDHLAEIEAIVSNPAPASFDNTLAALEKSGRLLDRVEQVFFGMISAHTNETLEGICTEIAPALATHRDSVLLNSGLFEKLSSVYAQKDSLNLDPESLRLTEETYAHFVRAGATLSADDKEKVKLINTELASLQTRVDQNILHEANDKAVVVDSVKALEGLSAQAIAAAKEEGVSRDMDGKYVLSLLNTSSQPALTSLKSRDLRQRILEVSLGRGSSGGEYDNREPLTKIAKLRAEKADLQGFDNHAAYVLDRETARTPQAVNELLASLTPGAVSNARTEAADLQEVIDAEGGGFQLAAWDWDYYAEKLRQSRYSFDEAELKPYFELNNVLEKGVFFAAEKLYGLRFELRQDLPVYHPDVRVWEVFDADGSTLSLFIEDMYARSSKQGGAWMNAYVSQSSLLGTQTVIGNHLNVTKPPAGEKTLLTWAEVTTLFHEFGHALHGMFSNVQYPSFSGTSVPCDFVEFPSQVNEMWAEWPEVLANYAVHCDTGEAMPAALLEKVLAAMKFNQGFATTEYLSASLLDQSWHQKSAENLPDAEALLQFEADSLKQAGVDLAIVPPRYRSTYFSHIIDGYSAGYYAYIWSEVLDADAVEWFKENDGLNRSNGEHFRKTVLSRGGAEDATSLYRSFRGADADVKPLLIRRGLN